MGDRSHDGYRQSGFSKIESTSICLIRELGPTEVPLKNIVECMRTDIHSPERRGQKHVSPKIAQTRNIFIDLTVQRADDFSIPK